MSKDSARAATAASRAARSAAALAEAGDALARLDWDAIAPGAVVTCYASMADEPPTTPLIARLEARGTRVALPIMGPHRSLAWGWHTAELTRNDYGVSQPDIDPGFEVSSADAVILPAQRVGRDGTRLGRGAGYYDRALAGVPRHSQGGPVRIAVVFDDEVEPSVPHDDWDQGVDIIATPSGAILLADDR